jgi:hypothetical protein
MSGLRALPAARGAWSQAAREFLYGMTAWEFEQEAREARGQLESLFLLALFGDMLGVPVLPPWFALRLLPHFMPRAAAWKRRVLRERALGDDHVHHLHGV